MNSAILIDGRNYLDPDTIRAAGFAYEGIGRQDGRERRRLMQALVLVGGRAPACAP